MLKVKGFAGVGRGLLSGEVSQLVVEDSTGNPVLIALEHGAQVLVSLAGDEDFAGYCLALGLKPPETRRVG